MVEFKCLEVHTVGGNKYFTFYHMHDPVPLSAKWQPRYLGVREAWELSESSGLRLLSNLEDGFYRVFENGGSLIDN